MDLSKLPKMSQTPRPTDPAGAPGETAVPPLATTPEFCRACGATLRPGARFCDACGAPARSVSVGSGAEAWLSIAIGIILLVMFPTMMKYLSSRLFGSSFAPFELSDGTVVPYPKVYPQ